MAGKVVSAVFCVFLLLAVFLVPQKSGSKPLVDESYCLGCHELGQFGAQDGSLHGTHSNCTDCHDGTPGRGNVSSSNCIECHPLASPGQCQLATLHEESISFDPSGPSCFDCHPDCDGGGETTTTTTGPPSIVGTRWEVLLAGPFREGCRSTTMNLRSDNVITFDCIDGFGTYISFGGFFTAVYWSNNYYQGYGLGLVISGVTFNPYLIAGGIAYFSTITSPVLLTGYAR